MRHLIALPVLALGLAAPVAAAQDEPPATLAELSRSTPVRALDGLAVVSRFDASRDAYRLALLRDDRLVDLPVAPSPTPLQADLGAGEGGPVVVFTRCREDDDDREADGCDLRILRLTGGGAPRGTERPIANANTRGASETSPTVSKGRLAFVRTTRSGPVVYTKRLDAPRSRRSQRVAVIPARDCRARVDPGRSCRTRGGRVEELELSGRRLAAAVSYEVQDVVRLVRLADVTGAPTRTVERFTVGEALQTAIGLSFADGSLAWYKTCLGDPSGCVRGAGAFRLRLATGRLERAPDSQVVAGFTLQDATTALRVEASQEGGCEDLADPDAPASCRLVRQTDLTWEPTAERPAR